VATIGLFVLAVVVIALAFWIQSIVGDDDDDGGTPASEQTQTAQTQTANAGGDGTQEPDGSPTDEPTGTETAGEDSTPTPSGENTYTVQAGDTCFSIAEANGVTLEEFLVANNLDDESCTQLEIGQVVIIP
jgi:LysM repeat protein